MGEGELRRLGKLGRVVLYGKKLTYKFRFYGFVIAEALFTTRRDLREG